LITVPIVSRIILKKVNPEKSVRFSKMVTGLVDVFILSILNKQPQTGYGIRKILDKKMNVKVSYGLLYPILHILENASYIEGKWVPQSKVNNLKKKIYRITPSGSGILSNHIHYLETIISSLKQKEDMDIKIAPHSK
jgi:DNA-binding PadR family transcriptional regulator